jgi:radical SAM protein with 4Fe4S-binding SPASM domain
LEKVFIQINEYLEKHPSETFSIVWHGGEPCIVGERFYEKVLEYQHLHCANTQQRIEHDLQTNLTLINQNLIDIFKKMGINRVGTSYEPYKGIRGFGPNRDSDAYNAAFYKGIELIERNGFSWGFIYVVTRAVLDKPIELFRILTNFKVKGGFQLHPVYSYKNEDKNGVGISAVQFADFLGSIFPIWWENRERYPFVEPFFSYLNHYHKGGPVCCSESGCCYNTHIYIGPSGTLSHCGRASDWDVFKVGNISDMTICEAFEHPYRLDLKKRDDYLKNNDCKGCEYFSICHGGCPLDGWNHADSVLAKTEWCVSKKLFLKKYFEPITGLTFNPSIYHD